MADGSEPTTIAEALAIPSAGRYPCNVCGAELAMPGVCSGCDSHWLTEQIAERLRRARASIPARFRWARFDEPMLAKRVSPSGRAEVEALFGRTLPTGIALVGEAGAGKTSLACAMLRRVHDSARWDSPEPLVSRAAGAFYVSAPDMLQDWTERQRGEVPASLTRARHATILVLDNVEPGARDDVIGRLIMQRHDDNQRGRTTIVTTWMDRATAAKAYGDGWARRVYEKEIQC